MSIPDASGPGVSPSSDVVRFKRLPANKDLPLPSRATPRAAGYDVRSAEEDFVLAPQEIRLVSTGLEMELPEGMECQVRPSLRPCSTPWYHTPEQPRHDRS